MNKQERRAKHPDAKVSSTVPLPARTKVCAFGHLLKNKTVCRRVKVKYCLCHPGRVTLRIEPSSASEAKQSPRVRMRNHRCAVERSFPGKPITELSGRVSIRKGSHLPEEGDSRIGRRISSMNPAAFSPFLFPGLACPGPLPSPWRIPALLPCRALSCRLQ